MIFDLKCTHGTVQQAFKAVMVMRQLTFNHTFDGNVQRFEPCYVWMANQRSSDQPLIAASNACDLIGTYEIFWIPETAALLNTFVRNITEY